MNFFIKNFFRSYLAVALIMIAGICCAETSTERYFTIHTDLSSTNIQNNITDFHCTTTKNTDGALQNYGGTNPVITLGAVTIQRNSNDAPRALGLLSTGVTGTFTLTSTNTYSFLNNQSGRGGIIYSWQTSNLILSGAGANGTYLGNNAKDGNTYGNDIINQNYSNNTLKPITIQDNGTYLFDGGLVGSTLTINTANVTLQGRQYSSAGVLDASVYGADRTLNDAYTSFSGGITINNGGTLTLKTADGKTAGNGGLGDHSFIGAVTITNPTDGSGSISKMVLNQVSGDRTFSNSFSGDGNLVKTGEGSVTLTADVKTAFTGTLDVQGGKLIIGTGGTSSTSGIEYKHLKVSNGATVQFNGSNKIAHFCNASDVITFGEGGGTLDIIGTTNFHLNSTTDAQITTTAGTEDNIAKSYIINSNSTGLSFGFNISGKPLTFNIGEYSELSVSSTITNNSATNVSKTGAGTLILDTTLKNCNISVQEGILRTSNVTYFNGKPLTLTGGTFQASNNMAFSGSETVSFTENSGIDVMPDVTLKMLDITGTSGKTLEKTGLGQLDILGEISSGDLKITSGVFSPGNSVGTTQLLNGDFTLGADGTMLIEFFEDGSDFDQLILDSGTALAESGSTLQFNLNGLSPDTPGTRYGIITGGTLSGWENVRVTGLSPEWSWNATNGELLYTGAAPQNIPEPCTYLMFVLATAIWAIKRRIFGAKPLFNI